jgi:phospholipase A-2-activating protein
MSSSNVGCACAAQVGHSNYVVTLQGIAAGCSPMVAGVGLVSGSRDKSAIVWDVETSTSVAQLVGHDQQVNAVAALSTGEIATGSLDGVLKIWKAGRSLRTIKAHEAPVLCMLALADGDVLTGLPTCLCSGFAHVCVAEAQATTILNKVRFRLMSELHSRYSTLHRLAAGSGDNTIKQWSGNLAVHTFVGHKDSVRCLCNLPGLGFVSGSHDSTLRVWSLAGDCLAVLVGHQSLVYTCAALPCGKIISGVSGGVHMLWQ